MLPLVSVKTRKKWIFFHLLIIGFVTFLLNYTFLVLKKERCIKVRAGRATKKKKNQTWPAWPQTQSWVCQLKDRTRRSESVNGEGQPPSVCRWLVVKTSFPRAGPVWLSNISHESFLQAWETTQRRRSRLFYCFFHMVEELRPVLFGPLFLWVSITQLKWKEISNNLKSSSSR